MNKKIKGIIFLILSILLFIILFYKIDIIKELVTNNSIIYFKNVFPILFISNILINIINNSPLLNIIYKYTKNIYIYIFIISILSGCPFNSIVLKDLYNKKIITKKDIEYIICFTTINNPLFIYSYLKNCLSIMFLLYLYNIIIFIIFYKKLSHINKLSVNNYDISLPLCIKDAIYSQINIFASIIFFSFVSDLLVTSTLSYSCLLKGLLEVTKGLNCLVNINFQTKIKELYFLIILLFNGLSIHIQISNNLPKDINYKLFYITKLIPFIMLITTLYK